MARILLGVSGGIAAYKALELARLATREGHAVRVLMTPAAERFIGPASFEGIVGPSPATPRPATIRSAIWSWWRTRTST